MINVYQCVTEHELKTGEQVRKLETQYCQQHQLESYKLMQRAGKSAWQLIQKLYPKIRQLCILVGPGNNGGDGLEVACLAQQAGLTITLMSASNKPFSYKNDAHLAYLKTLDAKIELIPFSATKLHQADLIVDAILGTGLTQPARESTTTIIQQLNQSQIPILSLDVPSGLDADTGAVIGGAIHAATTLTFIAVKTGLVTADGKDYCGKLYLAKLEFEGDDLKLSSTLENSTVSNSIPVKLAGYPTLFNTIKARQNNVHKGLFGHVLIIGGNQGLGGAAIIAAKAACRTGAGAVSLITLPEHVNSSLSLIPEVMVIGTRGSNNSIANQALTKASAIVIGPGLGKDDWAKYWLTKVLSLAIPKVIDADGLRLAKDLGMDLSQTVITPHPGEAAYLLDCTTETIQNNRLDCAKEIQQRTGATLVLKGSGSIICSKDTMEICRFGNPAMATAGMGDALAGMIGALIAQPQIRKPVASAVLLHALAGDMASQNYPLGLLASDLIEKLPLLFTDLLNKKTIS